MSTKEEKLRAVFEESYHALVYFAYRFVGSRSEAEDLVQDAFASYWNQTGEISDSLPAIKSYLYQSVRNASLNVLRHRLVRDRYEQSNAASEEYDKNSLELMLEAETMAILFKAISTLPSGCRTITEMSYLQGKKNEEIAVELGISVNTVKTQKQRGLQLLRSKLSPTVLATLLGILS